MTNEEAYKILMSDADFDFGKASEKNKQTADALCVAVNALKKQIPKKARQNSFIASGIFHKTYFYTCPTCGNVLITKMMNERQNTSFCWDCGQKLDWREGEQE